MKNSIPFCIRRKYILAKIVIADKKAFTKKTIQKAQQNIDVYLNQKNSIATTTES
jgi:hypothetical protein